MKFLSDDDNNPFSRTGFLTRTYYTKNMAANELTLYFYPSSFYSHKAYLALCEKGVPFKERIVHIRHGEQNEEWYIRKVNPKGTVPVLQAGQHFITESEDIVDYVDSRYKAGPRLVPDVGTKEGQEVERFRKLLNAVPIGLITNGVLAHRQFCTSERAPKAINKDSLKQKLTTNIKECQRLKKSNPDLSGDLDKKIRHKSQVLHILDDEGRVAVLLDNLGKQFDEIEARLEQSKMEISTRDLWLFGNNFTAVDIFATILFFRLNYLGVLERFISETKRPLVFDYYTRLMERPSMKKLKVLYATVPSLERRRTMKLRSIKAVKIGLVIGVVILGVLGLREIYTDRRGLQRTS